MRALPARRSQVFTLGSQRVGLGVKTGCYISARSFAAIQFSRPQAPRLSAELRTTLEPLRATKTPTSRWAGKLSRVCAEATPLVPLLGCQKVPLHQLEKYTTWRPGVNNTVPDFRRHDPGFTSRPGGNKSLASRRISPLSCRTFALSTPMNGAAQMSAPAIVAPFEERSSDSEKDSSSTLAC